MLSEFDTYIEFYSKINSPSILSTGLASELIAEANLSNAEIELFTELDELKANIQIDSYKKPTYQQTNVKGARSFSYNKK